MNAIFTTDQRIVMDGAMGTELIAHGLDLSAELPANWNLTHPDRVRAVHRAYIDAGADVLLTNTFLTTDIEVLRAGIELARAEEPSAVLLDIGPVRGLPQSEYESRAFLAELPPIDGILLETFSDAEALGIAAAFASCDVPVLLSMTYRRSGGEWRSRDGESPEWFAEQASSCGIRGLGVNCGADVSFADIADIIARYRGVTAMTLIARPNAGFPARSSEALLRDIPVLVRSAANWLGGCCGTTPAFIAGLRAALTAEAASTID